MIALVILLAATEPPVPPGIGCDQVRAMVAEHGYMHSLYWARSQGYSWRQIAEAKKCLHATTGAMPPRP